MSLIEQHSPAREHVCRALLASPEAIWTVASLTAATPTDVSITADALRVAVYLLLDDGAVELQPGQRVVAIRLKASGRARVNQLLERWQTSAAGSDGTL